MTEDVCFMRDLSPSFVLILLDLCFVVVNCNIAEHLFVSAVDKFKGHEYKGVNMQKIRDKAAVSHFYL